MTSTQTGTCEWLSTELERTRVLEASRLKDALDHLRQQLPEADVQTFAEFLVQHRLLTPFQAQRALEGDARKLVLGPYLLVDAIGAGSMGTVFQARGRGDDAAYAVKVLPMRSLWNVRMARKQVRSFAALSPHISIVPFVDVGSAVGAHYLVWPFVEGTSLDRVVRERGPLDAQESVSLAIQLAEGLVICHNNHLFHGLLKPSNVLINDEGEARMADFGIGAIMSDNLDDQESLIDTISTANATANMLDCAAPESLADPTRRDPLGDQYSLGCTLYYAVTGRYPFPGDNVVEKMVAHQTQTPPSVRELNPNVPAPLENAIVRLMQKAPEARFGDLSELFPLLGPLSSRPVAIRRPTPGKPQPMSDSAQIRTARFLRQAQGVGLKGDEFQVDSDSSKTLPKPVSEPPRKQPASPPPPKLPFSQPAFGKGMAPPAKPKAPKPAADEFVSERPKEPVRSAPPIPPIQPKSPERPEDWGKDLDEILGAPPMTEMRRPSDIRPEMEVSPFDAPLAPPPAAPVGKAPSVAPPAPEAPKPSASPSSKSEGYASTTELPAEAIAIPHSTSSMLTGEPEQRLNVMLPPPPKSSLTKKVTKALFFWEPPSDTIQCSLFAVPRVKAGGTAVINIFLHHPLASRTVMGLATNFGEQTHAVGAGYLQRDIQRQSRLSLFLDVQNAQVQTPLQEVAWEGQPELLAMHIHISPETPRGRVDAVLSIGQDDMLIGQVSFELTVE